LAANRKPLELHLLDGTLRTTRHGNAAKAQRVVERTKKRLGLPVMPENFTGEAKAAWERYIVPAFWLDRSREPAAIAFCKLWQRFMEDPDEFTPNRHSTLLKYMADLGLTKERNRIANGKEEEDNDDPFAA
jgi:hypothetical protein